MTSARAVRQRVTTTPLWPRYEQAPPRVRRLFNQRLFKRVFVEDDEVAEVELGEAIPDLMDRDYVAQLRREAANPGALS